MGGFVLLEEAGGVVATGFFFFFFFGGRASTLSLINRIYEVLGKGSLLGISR